MNYQTAARTLWMSTLALMCFYSSCVLGAVREIRIATLPPLNRQVVFCYRMPEATDANHPAEVLLLVPGYNGFGLTFLEPENNEWTRFADEHGLALIAPTFHTDMDELRDKIGYYYPALWSGKATLDALAELRRREHVDTDQVLMFGFSAGAHFTHRFALWMPEKVKAFVAYSAAWWDDPSGKIAHVPGLIMCGEADERYNATLAFMMRGQQLGLPLIWRGYRGTGHELTPAVLRMAQAFLGYYAHPLTSKVETFVGDLQRYEYFSSESKEAGEIPPNLRVRLPSREVAEAWVKEN